MVGFVGALVVLFLLMVWVGLGSVVVVFGWVISMAIVLRACVGYMMLMMCFGFSLNW